MENSKQRIINLDLVRTFAILFVILCHSVEIIYSRTKLEWVYFINLFVYKNVEGFSRLFMIIIYTIGKLGVPLFLFLTGTLILSKKFNTDKDILDFYKKNLLPLVIVYMVWTVFYYLFINLGNLKDVNIFYLIQEMFFLKSSTMPHMWYLPMIIGIYIALPFMSKIVHSFSKKSIYVLLSIMSFYLIIIPMIENILKIFKITNHFNVSLNTSIFGGFCGIYVFLGYYLYTNRKKINKLYVAIVGLLSFIITVSFQIIAFSNGYGYYLWYDFPFLMISAACLFLLLCNININFSDKFKSLITITSKLSLGMFLVHRLVLRYINIGLYPVNISLPIKVLIIYIWTLIETYLVVYVFSQIKFVSKHMLLIKH
jgi:surface polysaccharide O-acyltransferase-like enzyme